MKKRVLCCLLTAVMVFSLTACGGGSDESTSQGSGVTVDGKELDAEQYYNTYLVSDPSTLDSVKLTDNYGWAILTNIMEPLTRMSEEDGENVRVGAGAETWESNEDGTVWTFHLRDNTWTDGQAVTANDYVYGITRTLDPESGSPNAYLITCIKNGAAVNNGEMDVSELGVKAVDDKTLEITLEQPSPYFISLTDTRAMLPQREDIVEQYGDTYGAEADTIIGCGPFKLESWTHNSEIVAVKNEDYWNAEEVYLDTVDWKIISDENALYSSFENESLDIVGSATKEWMEKFSTTEGVDTVEYVSPAVRYNFYNTKDELFSNYNIRKAFSIALDRDDVSNTIYDGAMLASYSWVPEGVSTGELGDFRAQSENPMEEMMKEDPKEVLLQGMKELGLGDDPSTITVTLSFGDTSQWMRKYGEYYQQVFKEKLGVNIELDYNEWSTFQSKTVSGDYQMGYMSWSIDYNDPISMLENMTSDAGAIPTFWSNEEYDKLIAQAKTEMDEAARVELYKQAEKILFDEGMVLCPVVNEQVHSYRHDYMNNLPTTYFNTMGLIGVFTSGR
ncbi:MAG: peptide ABC transporter substrate-binding protein [Lachnospiraceae bacterium]|nr:peptide ABC transporter substrate-binding protein [Lachnospiraceae bacterium]